LDLVDTNSKVAGPRKFKDKWKWLEWEKAFVNYLSVILVVNGVPLAYVVCKDLEPEDEAKYLSFNKWMIARAPREGQFYTADLRYAHNLITNYVQGKHTESWICTIAHY
jgi:DMSO/TMAO reductase YedYZ molybdopterin-dependent catalytic subunit